MHGWWQVAQRLPSPSHSSNPSRMDDSLPPVDQPTSAVLRWHYTNPILVGGATAVALLSGIRFHARFVKRVANADVMGPEWLRGRHLRGVVTRHVHSWLSGAQRAS